MNSQKLRVRLYSFDHRILEDSVKKIVQIVVRSNGKVVGPYALPNKVKRFTIPRATFKYAKHADKIEQRIHKRLLDILQVNNNIVNDLSTLQLPAGVEIRIEATT